MILALPPLLIEMMEDGRWSDPGAAAIALLAPFIKEELEFRTSQYQISTGECLMGPDEDENEIFHEYRGSRLGEPRDLPWIDIEKSALIAINRIPGDDIAIALDYRTSMTDPRVIGTEWIDGTNCGCFWREISPTFTAFASAFAESKQAQNKRMESNG
jgi:hypothetical protein